MRPRSLTMFLLSAWVATACNESALQTTAPDAGEAVGGLTPEQASRTIAKVGEKPITLGDFARTLDRMDQFDRLRYQTKERRRDLLNDIIDVELLAMEAKRRGLDKQPETEDSLRQILRDAMLAKARQDLPAPAEIPAAEIRAYYDANAEMFREPERRRVSAIVFEEKDRKDADKVLKAAQKIKSAAEWGELVQKHGPDAKAAAKDKKPSAPADLAGDLGIVGPPDDPKGENARVPDAVRAAVFKIGAVGEVGAELAASEGKLFVVRLSGITAAHSRSREEADRSIRVAILQQKMQEREKAVEADLRKKFPVEIDEKALAAVKIPDALMNLDAGTGASPYARTPESPSAVPNAPPPGVPPDAGR